MDGGHCLRHGIGALLAHSVLCHFRRTYSAEGPDHTGRSWRNRGYRWSEDNGGEIRKGWISASDSALDLAGKLGIKNGARLHETVESYRRACAAGADEKFGRAQKTLAGLEGRLYGIALWPCLLNTQGGPRRNVRGEILDVRGDPIRRLYGAGELGSIWGFLYQSGGNLGECLGLGRMVGLNVAAEPSLS